LREILTAEIAKGFAEDAKGFDDILISLLPEPTN
jgi:hypothetical protein